LVSCRGARGRVSLPSATPGGLALEVRQAARSGQEQAADSIAVCFFHAAASAARSISFREAACIGLAVLAPARESVRQPSGVECNRDIRIPRALIARGGSERAADQDVRRTTEGGPVPAAAPRVREKT